MSDGFTTASGDGLGYAYRPSLMGAARQFKLDDDGIEWTTGRHSGRIAYRDVRRLRMSYKPANMQSQRFVTEVWAEGAPKLTIISSSWKSMFEQERLDKPYSAFVAELHRRLIRAAAPVRYEQGTLPLKYWPALAVFAAIVLGLGGLIVRGLQANEMSGAALVAGFLALLFWKGGVFFQRNRPGFYRPEAPPAAVMPKV
ncbi:MAG: hypothetical protein HY244_07890 [Rhizobiales bacterium]|nr:hypothetical protein [Hyphomicrobiales bacterium]